MTAQPQSEALFLEACRVDAERHGGYVSVNNVRRILSDSDGLIIEPRRFARLWQKHTGPWQAMVTTMEVEVCSGSTSGNDGRLYRLRRWVA